MTPQQRSEHIRHIFEEGKLAREATFGYSEQLTYELIGWTASWDECMVLACH